MIHNPKKILILGNGASGKTTLAKTLSTHLNIPLLHLDSVYWINGWKHNDRSFFSKSVNNFLNKEKWVIEGTPMFEIEKRISAADTIIFLDFKPITCLKRALTRSLLGLKSNKPKSEDDGCPAVKLSIKTFLWIWRFNKEKRNLILNKISSAKALNKYIIKNKKELNLMVKELFI